MITVIAEHSVDLDLLPEKANILDLGCRGFLFSNHFILSGHHVITVDCDPLVYPGATNLHYNLAISDFEGNVKIKYSKDPQATRINKRNDGMPDNMVPCTTLKKLSEQCSIHFWDLIKIDIEGSEYEVIMSLTEPPAKQLSIEFHLHTGIYDIKAVRRMESKLHNLGYEFVSHQMTSQHGCGMNYWDSLFILT
jgi:FkbM family methyltransferase